jgi:hypothetical protein
MMALLGHAATQYASPVQLSGCTNAPTPSTTSKQPWGQTVPQSPHPVQLRFRINGTFLYIWIPSCRAFPNKRMTTNIDISPLAWLGNWRLIVWRLIVSATRILGSAKRIDRPRNLGSRATRAGAHAKTSPHFQHSIGTPRRRPRRCRRPTEPTDDALRIALGLGKNSGRSLPGLRGTADSR